METNEQELIIIEQLPIITEKLSLLSEEIDRRVNIVLQLECTEETVKEVKRTRAGLAKEFNETFEERRKFVKNAIISPYEKFEGVYKICVSDKYKSADVQLKAKIDAVENELKRRKCVELDEYFKEYCTSKSIDFVELSQSRINITLSASMKSLKEQVKTFIDSISDDLALIETQEYKDEIFVEYRQSLNASQAITAVTKRHKAIEEQRRRQAELEARKLSEKESVKKVDAVIMPPLEAPIQKPAEDADSVKTVAFKVTAPLSKLKELKKFLNDGGYQYE